MAFVDNTDFFAGGDNVKSNIIEILRFYAELFQATRRKIQYEKISYFS